MYNYLPAFVSPVQLQVIEEANVIVSSSSQSGPNGAGSLSEGASTTSRPKCPDPDCGKDFAQKQVRDRHHREVHQLGLPCSEIKPEGDGTCKRCNYTWFKSRRYSYRKHLREVHGMSVDRINKKLGSPRRHAPSKSESKVRPNDSPPPTGIKCNHQHSIAEFQQRPQKVPCLAVEKNANYSPSPDLGRSIPPNAAMPGSYTYAPSSSVTEDIIFGWM